jgi:hypothetical protein
MEKGDGLVALHNIVLLLYTPMIHLWEKGQGMSEWLHAVLSSLGDSATLVRSTHGIRCLVRRWSCT